MNLSGIAYVVPDGGNIKVNIKRTLVLSLSFFLLITIAQAQTTQWIHVRVEEGGESGESVKVNVPASLVGTVLPMIQTDEFTDGKVKLDQEEFTVPQLREIWNEVKRHGNYELAAVKNEDVNLRIAIEGEYLFVRSVEGTETQVNAQIPTPVVDALFSGTGDELNVQAAVDALIARGAGDLVSVRDGDTTVRVWIDSSSVGE